MYKKTFGLFLTMTLLLSVSVFVHATEKNAKSIDSFVLDQSYISMIQEALDSITLDTLTTNARMSLETNSGINVSDITNNGELMHYLTEDLLAPVRSALNDMTSNIISYAKYANVDFELEHQLLAPITFHHELFENFTVTMDSSNGLVFTNVSYEIYIPAFERFLTESLGIADRDSVAASYGPNPYVKTSDNTALILHTTVVADEIPHNHNVGFWEIKTDDESKVYLENDEFIQNFPFPIIESLTPQEEDLRTELDMDLIPLYFIIIVFAPLLIMTVSCIFNRGPVAYAIHKHAKEDKNGNLRAC